MSKHPLAQTQLQPSDVYVASIQAYKQNGWELKKIITEKYDYPSIAHVFAKGEKTHIVVLPGKIGDAAASVAAYSLEEILNILNKNLAEYKGADIICPVAQATGQLFRSQHYIQAYITKDSITFTDSKHSLFYNNCHEQVFKTQFAGRKLIHISEGLQGTFDSWQCGHYVIRKSREAAGSQVDQQQITSDSPLLKVHGDLIKSGSQSIADAKAENHSKPQDEDFDFDLIDELEGPKPEKSLPKLSDKEEFIQKLEDYSNLPDPFASRPSAGSRLFQSIRPLCSAQELLKCLKGQSYRSSPEIINGLKDATLAGVIKPYQNLLPKAFQPNTPPTKSCPR